MKTGAGKSPKATDACSSAATSTVLPERGVILIALLWIFVALSGIALSFSRESFVEVAAARNAQALESSYFIARAGLAVTIYRLQEKRLSPQLQQSGPQDVPDPLDLGLLTGAFAGGSYRVRIEDEAGKISINNVTEQQLAALVEAAGIPYPDAAVIVDSILDWRDTDLQPRPYGAEDDYYMALNQPYQARNGLIETIEELLLVRGMNADYFYGRRERDPGGSVSFRYGLSRYLTLYSTSRQINVNFAPLPVLLSIPGMPPLAAEVIHNRRKVMPFRDIAEVTSELPVQLSAETLPFLTTGQTGTFTLTAAASLDNSKITRVIRTIINLNPGSKLNYETLYWNENITDYEGLTP
ncbi:MAG TPA: general secretion pathway protein GspK [Acidobacteriota bacterium]|nr:general secretion pathway protein GspK [Acidobacteriota bacterium]